MNALQKYVAKQTLIEKLGRVTSTSTNTTAVRRPEPAPVPIKVPSKATSPQPTTRMSKMESRLETSDIVDRLGRAVKRHRAGIKQRVAAAHKRSPGAYHPGTTRLKRYFKADGSMKGGWTQARKNPYYNPYLPTGSRILVKKGPDVGRNEGTAMRGHRR